MFVVTLKTVDALFECQDPRLQGQLRLDVSSGTRPNFDVPIDTALATIAVGERTLREILTAANEVAYLSPDECAAAKYEVTRGRKTPSTERSDYADQADSDIKLKVLQDRSFSDPIQDRLVKAFGVNKRHEDWPSASAYLATDLRDWSQSKQAARYGIEHDPNDIVYVRCERLPQERFDTLIPLV